MRRVTEQELDALGSVKTGLGLTFFGVAFGACVSFWIVLKTANLSPEDHSMFFPLVLGSALLWMFFGAWSVLEGLGARRLITRIRERPPTQ